jgi:hypothetical protein
MKVEEIKKLQCWFNGVFYTEEWKDVRGYEGLYSISNFGRVFVHEKRVSQIWIHGKKLNRQYGGFLLKGTIKKSTGYPTVCLTKDKKELNQLVHRLVAISFIHNIENKPQVNHIDGVKKNNFFKNLEWATSKENNQHAYKTGLNHSGIAHKQSITIYQFEKDGTFIKKWNSIGEIFRTIGLSTGCIASCSKGERPTAHGFKWKREVLSDAR